VVRKALTRVFLAGGFATAVFTAPSVQAATYSTSGAATQYSLGDTLGTQYDTLTVAAYSGTLVDGGTIILNPISFTAGINALVPQSYTGQFSISETMTVDAGTPQQLNIPFNLSISYSDTLTIIGGTTLSFLDGGSLWQIVVNGLVLGPNPGGTMYGYLTAHATDPVAQTPIPAALPLFASGLGGMGFFAVWKKRKAPSRS